MNQVAILAVLIVLNTVIWVEPYIFPYLIGFSILWYYMLSVLVCLGFLLYTGKYEKNPIALELHIPLRRSITWTYNLLFFSGGTFVFLVSAYFFEDVEAILWCSFGAYTVSLGIALIEAFKK